jgi:peptide/nickel transport system permease protein/peptide/nickel transport system substrate-binding protein
MRRLTSVALASALVLAACGSDDDDSSEEGTTPTTASAPAQSAAPTTPASAAVDTTEPVETTAAVDTTAPGTVPTKDDKTSTTAGSAGPRAKEGGTLRVAAVADPSSLDPQVGPGGNDHVMLYPIFDTLIRFDPKTMEPLPGLASEWTFDDPQTLRLTLHDGIKFHDGTPLDAAAVKASMERLKAIHAHADLDNVTSIDASGPLEVVLHLGTPDSSMLLVLADRGGMIVSPTAAADKDAFAQHPVGAGPFSFVEYRPGDRITYERFADYWGEQKPTLDGIEMRIISDRKAAANALIADQVDFAYGLDAGDYETISSDDSLTIGGNITLAFDMIYYNQGQKPLDDARVRNAINMAIDREELVVGAVDGRGEPAWLPVPPNHWAYEKAAVPTWPHDIERAKELMAEAGYADGATVTLLVSTQGTVPTTEAEIIKAQLEEIGVNLEITTMDINSAISQYFEAQAFNSFIAGWSGRPDVGLTYTRLFSKATYQNPAKVEIPGLEAVLAEAVATEDLDERAAHYAEANALITAEAPYMPLIFREGITALADNVVGYTPSLLGKPNVSFLGFS